MAQHPYTCPRCGPVRDALYGDDEQFHCSSLDCDEVVHILTEAERNPAKPTYNAFTQELKHPPKRPDPPKPSRASNGLSGKEILARMNARNRARKNGRAKAKKETTRMAKKKTSSRHGTCSVCHEEDVWLLANNPPRCAGCYRNNPTGPSKAEAPKRKTPVAKKKQTRRKNDSSITREVNAIEQVAEAVDDLTPQEIQRVFGFVAMRYAQTHGVAIQNVQPIGLGTSHLLEG